MDPINFKKVKDKTIGFLHIVELETDTFLIKITDDGESVDFKFTCLTELYCPQVLISPYTKKAAFSMTTGLVLFDKLDSLIDIMKKEKEIYLYLNEHLSEYLGKKDAE